MKLEGGSNGGFLVLREGREEEEREEEGIVREERGIAGHRMGRWAPQVVSTLFD